MPSFLLVFFTNLYSTWNLELASLPMRFFVFWLQTHPCPSHVFLRKSIILSFPIKFWWPRSYCQQKSEKKSCSLIIPYLNVSRIVVINEMFASRIRHQKTLGLDCLLCFLIQETADRVFFVVIFIGLLAVVVFSGGHSVGCPERYSALGKHP